MTFVKKAGQKLNAISMITPYKRLLQVNAFFYSQLNYCQLVWICRNRTNNNKINRSCERCLRLIYNDEKYCIETGSVSIHYRNLRTLTVELVKILKGLSLVIFAEAFPLRQNSQ